MIVCLQGPVGPLEVYKQYSIYVVLTSMIFIEI
jgi:hypothetical protein